MKVLRVPKVRIVLLLLSLFIVTLYHLPPPTSLFLLVNCVGLTVLFDLLFTYIRRKKLFVPYAALVTGLIFTLIIDPSATWYQILAISASAMAVKNFLRIGNRHVFNPAVTGLLVGWVLFGLSPSWWGPTFYDANIFSPLNLLILLLVIGIFYVSAFQLKRYVTIVTFLVVYAILASLLLSPNQFFNSIISTIVSPGTLFLAFLMVPEPMTSPVNKKRQFLYGLTVAIVNMLLVYLFIKNPAFSALNTPDASLVAILLGNLIFFKLR